MKTIASIILVVLLFSFDNIQGMHLEYSHTIKPKESPKRVVHNFLIWYKNNRENLQKFQLVAGKPGDSTRAYRVDFREAEKYLTALKNSGFVSDRYINSFRQYLESCDANFQKNPQYSGIPAGFEFDLVLKAREYDEILDRISKWKVSSKPINPDTTKVYLKLPYVYMVLQLSRSGDNWLIDSLDYV